MTTVGVIGGGTMGSPRATLAPIPPAAPVTTAAPASRLKFRVTTGEGRGSRLARSVPPPAGGGHEEL